MCRGIRKNSLLNFLLFVGFLWFLLLVFVFSNDERTQDMGVFKSAQEIELKKAEKLDAPIFDDFEDDFAVLDEKPTKDKPKIFSRKTNENSRKFHSRKLDPPPQTQEILDLHRLFNLTNPGHMGEPVTLPPHLPLDIKQKIKKSWEIYSINEFVSNLIPLYRVLPDVRPDYCKSVVYSSNLPVTSVIMVFHNEPFSLIMRSVFAVFKRTPERLLGEIVLVDDCSDRGE